MDKKEKKKNIILRFMPYMGKKKIFLPISLILSIISAIVNIIPIVSVWYIVREILKDPKNIENLNISLYAWVAFIAAIGGIFIYFSALMCSHLAAFHVETGLQKVGMRKAMKKPLGFFNENSGGRIRKILNDGAGTTHVFLAHQLPDIAPAFVTPIIVIVLMMVIDYRMGLATLLTILISFIIFAFNTMTNGEKFQNMYYDALEEMSSESVEYVRGIPVVKIFGQSIYSFKRFYNSIIKYRDMVFEYTLTWKPAMVIYTVFSQSAVFFLIPLSVILINRGEPIGVVITDFIFYMIIAPSFSIIMMKAMMFTQNKMIAEQAIDRIENLLFYPDMIFSNEEKVLKDNTLEFKDVTFTYNGGEKPAVEKISFKVKEGETCALVGPSGGGKTTIARLATRFWDADSGDILIGGVNIKDIPKKQLMENVSFVFQNSGLFKSSIRDNITFGMKNVKKEDLDKAIKYSQSEDIINNLPEGLDTHIGKEGTYLSGGEQQRIALARAILKDAPIVLLDEATAFADPENEELIQKALKKLSIGKTTLMIAHRLTTIENVDNILVVDAGKIVESGNHKELLEKKGLYYSMWNEYQKSIQWKVGKDSSGGEVA